MFTTKQKLITVATTLALGCGFTVSSAPAFADVNNNSMKTISVKEEQVRAQVPFTGYVIESADNYVVVANTATKEEALSYQKDWWELVSQNKILRVPISTSDHYLVGDKLNVFSAGWTFSLPPIAIMPTIEKIVE
ncbi:YobA family protein [Bacillus sp. FDAARGOS_1420]|uniref:YobA family protein n=2 Tax=unclassified Bacillus (in: firmicutes) TaxID=185979 RepID=UPI001C5B5227|nr:YobA family protein [Bacillus sp. FDAARGOS_1420]MBW3496547.1 YobA family protein [Bacillus sp. FDAARGOS_1420]